MVTALHAGNTQLHAVIMDRCGVGNAGTFDASVDAMGAKIADEGVTFGRAELPLERHIESPLELPNEPRIESPSVHGAASPRAVVNGAVGHGAVVHGARASHNFDKREISTVLQV